MENLLIETNAELSYHLHFPTTLWPL